MEQVKEKQVQQKPQKSRKGLVLLLLVLLLLLAAAVWLLLGRSKPEPPTGLVYEDNVVVGDLPGKTPEERQAELDEMVAEGMLALSINATPCTAADGTGNVNWEIENPSNQGKLIRVEISLKDDDTLIYQTGAIRPGSYVSVAPLDTPLDPGTYECVAMFYTYRLESEEFIGRAGAEITLTVS